MLIPMMQAAFREHQFCWRMEGNVSDDDDDDDG